MAKLVWLLRGAIVLILWSWLCACTTEATYAPVTDISMIEPVPASGVHKVTADETLYEIAWRYGLDYRTLAIRNHLQPPYTVYPSQILYLRAAKKPSKVFVPDPAPSAPVQAWLWPAKGKIIKPFSSRNKGINIAGVNGEPVRATAAGKVVYCGEGLKRYGKLIILKHNNLYLSAYAHNSAVFVKEGEYVIQGQKISEMGNSGADKVMLHFEIRRAGKPVNPASLLKKSTY